MSLAGLSVQVGILQMSSTRQGSNGHRVRFINSVLRGGFDRRALRLDVGKRLIMNVLQLLSLQIHTADSYG
jgi:hypothetical protein